ncbi:galactinol synthase [Klebsormidium nitens]|uniref:Hexosyltransferase n=1 Tax=Klebsormidium nitens TaxID=105231 RepID=A0A1Y1IHB3_KLENI|nr:galactinol synthase [Klebsormidium nitens]|eukprot:GAQ90255.1 galactinol synthase [Klebsormidium nitens]
MLLFQNIDELFDRPPGTLSAVMDCFCTWSYTVQYQLGYCQQAPHKVPWTADAPKPAPYFNAGMFVFEPSSTIFKDMLQKMEEWPATPFAEQDFLNRYFEAVYRPIPSCYNLVLAMLWQHPENVDVKKVKNVHYCAKGSKPWNFDPAAPYMDHPTVQDFVAQWKKVYNSESRAGQADVSLQVREAATLGASNMPTSADVQQKLLPKRIMA